MLFKQRLDPCLLDNDAMRMWEFNPPQVKGSIAKLRKGGAVLPAVNGSRSPRYSSISIERD
jgi:hypothetical protein